MLFFIFATCFLCVNFIIFKNHKTCFFHVSHSFFTSFGAFKKICFFLVNCEYFLGFLIDWQLIDIVAILVNVDFKTVRFIHIIVVPLTEGPPSMFLLFFFFVQISLIKFPHGTVVESSCTICSCIAICRTFILSVFIIFIFRFIDRFFYIFRRFSERFWDITFTTVDGE